MKKYLLIFMLSWLANIHGQTCNAVPVPFLEQFSGGALPACWTNQNPNSTSTNANVKWKFSGAADYGCTATNGNDRAAGSFAWVDASSPYDNIHTVELISPQINLTGLNVPYIQFDWFKNHSSSSSSVVPVTQYSNNSLTVYVNNGSGWVQIWTGNTNLNKWRTEGVALATSYVGQTIQIKFTVDKDVNADGYFYDDLLLDNVRVREAPTCINPSNLSLTSLTSNSATISWVAPAAAPAGGYDVYYSTNTTAPTTTTVPQHVGVAGPTFTIPGLTANTSYYIWVRSNCTATDRSDWIGPINVFTGYCIPTGTGTFYYMKTLTTTGAWTNINYSAASFTTTYINNTNTIINSSPGNTITVNMATQGSSTSYYYIWVDWNNDLDFTDSGEQLLATTSYANTGTGTIPIPAGQALGDYRVRFALSGSGQITSCGPGNSANYLDYTLRITSPPSCLPPSAANFSVTGTTGNSITVGWSAPTPAPAGGYDIYYNTTGTAPIATTVPQVIGHNATTYTIPGTTLNTTYYIWVRSRCSGTDQSYWTGPISVYTGYCNPTSGSSSTSYYINSIVTTGAVTNINYTANSYNVYTNNSATSILALAGSTISASIGTSSSTHYFKVWVDWNNDFDFDDPGEVVYASTSSYQSSVVASIPIPAGQAPGNYRIRFGQTFSGSIEPCASGSYGSFVDYTLTVYQPLPCTTAPPSGFSVTNVTATTAQINWLPSIGATYTIEYKKAADATWTVSTTTATNPSHIITGLEENTAYQVRIRTTCNGTDGTYSNPLPFTTTPLVYCQAGSTSTTVRGFISNVTVTPTNAAPVSNNSSSSTYTDYYNDPTKVITLIAGTAGNIVSVSKSWTGTNSQNYAVGVWIDFNRDGDFDDVGEKVLTSASSQTTPVLSAPAFTVPANAYIGPLNTRMRVIMRETTTPTPCGTFTYGEVEDYPVRIKPCETTTPTNVIVNAITDVSASVSWTPGTNNLSYVVEYRVAGSGALWTQSPIVTAIPYPLTGLAPATTYEVRVVAVCGTNYGSYTTPVEFTTLCDPAAPFVSVTQITPYTAVVNWTATTNASYVVRYRKVGDTQWLPNNPPTQPGYDTVPAGTTSYALNNLLPYTKYEVQVASVCTGSTTINTWSTSSVFTTERLCEMPPPGLTIINITPTTAEVTWDPYPGASYKLRYRKVGIPGWTEIVTNTNTYIITGLLELTKYEMQVANICSGTTGTYSDPYYFTTPTIVYCSMSSGSAANEHISKVVVKPTGKDEMISTSAASTYTNYTNDTTRFIELIQGSTGNIITVDKSWLGAQSDVGIAAWIDFNRDGIFDPTERILANGPNATSPATATFNVPADAFVSMTDYKYVVMRVALQKDGIPVNCVSFQNGEVEDYTVRISKPGVPGAPNQIGISIYPNPVRNVLYFKLEGQFKTGTYKLYNSTGQVVHTDRILNQQVGLTGDRILIDNRVVNKLVSGVYIVDIEMTSTVDGKEQTFNAQKKFIKE